MQAVKAIHEITLPKLTDTDEESFIVFWHKSEGDPVEKGDILVEVQTEKAVTEIEADASGVIAKIHKKRSEVVGTGDVLVTIETEAEPSGELPVVPTGENQSNDNQPENQSTFVKASPRVRKLAKDLGVDLATIIGTGKNGKLTVEDVQRAIVKTTDQEVLKEPVKELHQRVIATPSVRKLAREKGINLEELVESGFGGRIEKEDVLRLAEQKGSGKAETNVDADVLKEEIETVRLAGIRKATAKAMSHSKQTIPHVTHFAEADVTALVEHREKYKELAKSKGVKLTYMPYIVKALVSTLKQHKELNASIDETEENILYKKFYHIGVAVQTDLGLLVPVLKNADKKPIGHLAKEIDALTKTAKDNKLSIDQMKGGTCTISNIGSAGGGWFTPVINHPETAILGIGEITDKAIVKNGEIVIGKTLPLSLSYDHRVIDGVIAQNALNHIKTLLQEPELLLLDIN